MIQKYKSAALITCEFTANFTPYIYENQSFLFHGNNQLRLCIICYIQSFKVLIASCSFVIGLVIWKIIIVIPPLNLVRIAARGLVKLSKLHCILQEGKRDKRVSVALYLDFKNAVNAVNHRAIFLSLEGYGFPCSDVDLFRRLYSGTWYFVGNPFGETAACCVRLRKREAISRPLALLHPWQSDPPLPNHVTVDLSNHYPMRLPGPVGWEVWQRNARVLISSPSRKCHGTTGSWANRGIPRDLVCLVPSAGASWCKLSNPLE